MFAAPAVVIFATFSVGCAYASLQLQDIFEQTSLSALHGFLSSVGCVVDKNKRGKQQVYSLLGIRLCLPVNRLQT